MSIPVLNAEGLPTGAADFTGRVAEQEIKPHLIHETVVAELAARRAGTHSTKNRGEVRGGGSKPWRQKGTGRARQGSIRSPQWTGGGIVFGPSPRTYGGKVNRKIRQQAFRAALRAQADRGTLALIEAPGWDVPSTKRAVEYLRQAPDAINVRPLLVVVDDVQSVEARSFRNIAGVYILAANELQVVDIVAARAILFAKDAWERFTGAPSEVEAVTPQPKPAVVKTPKPKPARTPIAAPTEDEAPEAEAEAPEAEAPEAEAPEAEEADDTAADASTADAEGDEDESKEADA